jgi:hypothetical protein
MKKTESKWIECALEEATGLRNSEGRVKDGLYNQHTKNFYGADSYVWTPSHIQFAKLTPVKLVQVEGLPGWVTDSRHVHFIDLCFPRKFDWAVDSTIKRRLYERGVPVFFTQEEAIAAADAQIARMIAERDGEIVRFEAHWDCMVRTWPEELQNQLRGKRVRITVEEVKGNA